MASVRERPGGDYKGKYGLVLVSEDDASQREVELVDVRWNRVGTAERTLQTMSGADLKRRLRSAIGRSH
jgi:hypothetical protein